MTCRYSETFLVFMCLFGSCIVGQEILNMTPTYGPIAGGTGVTLSGVNLSEVEQVTFDTDTVSLNFSIQFRNDSTVQCLSPKVHVINQSAPLSLHFASGENVTTDDVFAFLPDPSITEVTPLRSIVEGGITQTIVGENLHSVYRPQLRITLIYQFDHPFEQCAENKCYTNEQDSADNQCRVLNSSMMLCNSKPLDSVPFPDLPVQDPDTGINNDWYQIYVGFEFDGLQTFRNYSIITVFYNPEVDRFENDMEVFQTYKGQTDIEIRGDYLNFGAKIDDYQIHIGNGSLCDIDSLITNRIQCRPPPSRPALDIHVDGAPKVELEVGRLTSFVGYLKYEEKPWDNARVRAGVIATVCVLALVIIIVPTVIVCLKKRRGRDGAGDEDNRYTTSPGLMRLIPQDMKSQLDPCLRDASRLQLGRQLAEGNFGSVHLGKFMDDGDQPLVVAAKTIKESGVTRQEFIEFLEEATLMRDFDHPNVLNLVGVVFKEGRPFVILPYMENGDLKSYLIDQNKSFTLDTLLRFGRQVADGMAYLVSMRCVHRDLAARNCMVSDEEIVKVADFGLARDMFQDDYYRVGNMARPLPIKWMAPECLDDHKFTPKSDVWSYGVLLWEVTTRGKRPYAHVDNLDLKRNLLAGYRLEKPEYLPDTIYTVMLKCWALDPDRRPTFETIHVMLDTILESEANERQLPEPTVTGVGDTAAAPRRYQNLSRYVETGAELHTYQRMSSEPTGYVNTNLDNLDLKRNLSEIDEHGAHIAMTKHFETPPEKDNPPTLNRQNSGYLAPTGASAQR